MSPSPSATPSPSRLRRRAAILVLVVACLGTVATSPPRSPSITAEFTGPTMHFTQDKPWSTRRFVARATARNSNESIGGSMSGMLTARWKPIGVTTSSGPTLRSRLVHPGDTANLSRDITLDTPDTPKEVSPGGVFFPHCELDERCELEVELHIEVVGELGEGTVEVDWTLQAEAYAHSEDTPKGFALEIQER
ncbi:hypothetical protein ACLESD_16315 [Pyxidicoccus sp. 3LFB2]